jgi:hypothetical protein
MRNFTNFLHRHHAWALVALCLHFPVLAYPASSPPVPTNIPAISVVPDSLYATLLNCNDSVTLPVWIYNTGGENLNYSVTKVTSFYEDFENGLSKWTWDGLWGITTNSHEGNGALSEYPDGYYFNYMNQYITLNDSLYVFLADSCILRFWMQHYMECCCDYIQPQISVNNGGWITLGSWNCSTDWTQYTINLSSYVATGDYLKFRFHFSSDVSVVSDGVSIDNLSIGGTGISGDWMVISPFEGTVAPGDSALINITVYASGMNAGLLQAALVVQSNDPLNPVITIPVFITLVGSPEIGSDSASYTLPPVMVYNQSSTVMMIVNTGCNVLTLDSMLVSETYFAVGFPGTTDIPPGGHQQFMIYFDPVFVGLHTATLWVFNNDTALSIPLQGVGLPMPAITVAPDTFHIILNTCTDTAWASFTVYNNGGSDLITQYVSEFTNSDIDTALCKPAAYLYCEGMGIYNVSFNTINKTSTNGCDGFQDFSDSSYTTVVPGQTYSIYVGTGPEYNENVRAWIDFNGDGIFNMTNEFVFNNSGFIDHSGYIDIPQGLPAGKAVRMRIMSDYYWTAVPEPCVNLQYGQAEDYRVIFGGPPVINPDTTLTPPGDSSLVTVMFPASMFNSGFSTGLIHALSNDPLNPDVTLYFDVTFNGYPIITVNPDTIHFPDILEFESNTQTFTVMNTGCDELEVYNIVNNVPEFTVNPVSFALLPGESQQVSVVISSDSTAEYQSTLEIQNNDTVKYVFLQGTVLGAAQILVNPDTLAVIIAGCGDSLTIPVMVTNTGSDTLLFEFHQITDWEEDFENGITGWYTVVFGQDDFWHVSQLNSHSPTHALWCGIESLGHYGNGRRINTAIVSPPIDLTYAMGNIMFSFWEIFSTESGYDYCMVEISTDNGASWSTLRGGVSGNSGGWKLTTLDLSAYSGQVIRIRFHFDTNDALYNNYSGWFVDDILITNAGIGTTWLTIVPDSASLVPGDSMAVNFNFFTQGIPSGFYTQFVNVSSNATLDPQIIIPVSLQVNGIGIPELSTDTLVFPTIMQYTTATQEFSIINIGCDTLFITGIIPTLADFQANPDTFSILPFDTATVIVSFTPQDTGTYSESLTVFTSNGSGIIQLLGAATGAPGIWVDPDTVNVTLTSCNDTVSVPITLTNTGLIDLEWQTGVNDPLQENYALRFTNNDSYGYFGYWTNGSTWTIEAWVNPSSLPSGRKTIFGGVASCIDWAIVMQDGYFGIAIRPPGSCSNTILSPDPVVPGQWYHVAGTNDGTTASIYVNGQLKNQGPVDPNYVGFYYMYLAYEYCCYGAGFPGIIDEVRIWNFPRSAFDLNAWMYRPLEHPQNGLIAYYPLDEPTGTTITDLSGYGHNGNYYGAVERVVSNSPFNHFIDVNPPGGTTSPGDTTTIILDITSFSLISGIYQSFLEITSNDPQHPSFSIPVTVTVDGQPEVMLSDTCLAFGSVLQYSSVTDTFTLSNKGCDTLFIDTLVFSSPAFQAQMNPQAILPFSAQQVIVIFHPIAIGTYNDTLYIISNAGTDILCLTGEATPIPYIVTQPLALADTFTCEISGQQNLVIKNTGVIPLDYFITPPAESWLSVAPLVGLLYPGDSQVHVVNYSKIGLAVGTSTVDLMIHSNDPLHNPTTVLVALHVVNAYNPANLGPDKHVCEGNTVVLDPGTGYTSYLWNDNSVDSSLLVSAPGAYYVSVEDSYYCSYYDTVEVFYYPYPVAYAGNDTTVCQGTNYTFNPTFQNLMPITPTIVQIGTANNFVGDVGPSPFGTYYMDDRTQLLYRASEMAAVGMAPGMISAIEINVGSIGAPSMQGFTIKMGHYSSNTLTGFVSITTQVYYRDNFTPVTGWNAFTFDAPFYWDGSNNIVIEICFNNNSWISSSSVQYTSATGTVWSNWCDNCAPGCTLGSGSSFSQRANIRLYGEGDVTRYEWTGPQGYHSNLRNAIINNVSFTNAGIYILYIDNSVGCTDRDTVILAVNASPVVNAGSDVTIVYGDFAQLNATATGGSPPYTYSWNPISGLNNPLIANPLASPPTTTTYTVVATSQDLCTDADEVVVTVLPIYQINGTVTYKNSAMTPLDNLTIYLRQPGGAVIDTSITTSSGEYLFENLFINTYSYTVETTKPWGGANATDALEVAKHIVYLTTLTGLHFTAGDVNNSGTLTSVDPLLILRRTVGLIGQFPAGDWVFETTPIIISSSDVTHNFQGLCYGDVNGSNIPGLKYDGNVDLKEKGNISIPPDRIVLLPVRTEKAMDLGALTFNAKISSNIEKVLGIDSPGEGLQWNLSGDNTLRIAWQDTEGRRVNDNDNVIVIKLLIKEAPLAAEPALILADGSEFADPQAVVIKPVRLFIPRLGEGPGANEYSITVLPNPFMKETQLVYTLPDEGNLQMELFDIYGRKVSQLASGYTAAGTFRTTVMGDDLPSGVYQVVLRHDTGKKLVHKTVNIVKTY